MRILDVGLDWQSVVENVMNHMGNVKYSYFDIINIGYKEIMLKWGLKKMASLAGNESGEVCSEFIADILNADPRFKDWSTLISPVRLESMLCDHLSSNPINIAWP